MNGLGGNKFLLKLFILFCFAPDQTIFSVMSMWTGEHEGLFFFMRVTIAFSIVEIKILNFFYFKLFFYVLRMFQCPSIKNIF